MLSLTRDFEDQVKLSNGKIYALHLDYQTVLRWYEMLADKKISAVQRIIISFAMFVDHLNVSLDEKAKVVNYITSLITERPYNNRSSGKSKINKKYFSYTKDAEAIYASFFYDYHIDLLKNREMRWEKFQALFSNLSTNSPFVRIVEIRQKDTSNLKGAELTRIINLQHYYALDEQDTTNNLEIDMQNAFSILESVSEKKGG